MIRNSCTHWIRWKNSVEISGNSLAACWNLLVTKCDVVCDPIRISNIWTVCFSSCRPTRERLLTDSFRTKWFSTLSQANPVSKLMLGYVSNEASIAFTANINASCCCPNDVQGRSYEHRFCFFTTGSSALTSVHKRQHYWAMAALALFLAK